MLSKGENSTVSPLTIRPGHNASPTSVPALEAEGEIWRDNLHPQSEGVTSKEGVQRGTLYLQNN